MTIDQIREEIRRILDEGQEGDNDDWTWRDELKHLLARLPSPVDPDVHSTSGAGCTICK